MCVCKRSRVYVCTSCVPAEVHVATVACDCCAQTMLSNGSRGDAHRMALFMSDGHSNVNRDKTIPTAIELRQVLQHLCRGVSTVHRESKKETNLLPVTSPNVNRFSNSFAGRLSAKFANPPHLKYVAALPCEISMFDKSPRSRSN